MLKQHELKIGAFFGSTTKNTLVRQFRIADFKFFSDLIFGRFDPQTVSSAFKDFLIVQK